MEGKRIVVKIGSSSLTQQDGGLSLSRIQTLATGIASLCHRGWKPVLVSSGAIAAGLGELTWNRSTLTMPERQAAAAVGQGLLMEHYNHFFSVQGINTAQVLLTKEDLSNRQRYLNARNTINVLLDRGILPIVNENDTVTHAEIKFGDNDTLSALVAGLIEAQLLIILTDTDGLYNGDPRKDPQAKLIPLVKQVDEKLVSMAGGSGSSLGTGGMRTKLIAARIAAHSGIPTLVTGADKIDNIVAIAQGEQAGTRFEPAANCLRSRQQWIAFNSIARGTITIDDGAVRALLKHKKSLLAVGVVQVKGDFANGSVVSVQNEAGEKLAKGISNLSSEDLRLIIKSPRHGLEIINRDWLVCKRSVAQ